MARQKIDDVRFFQKPAKELARDLLGMILCYRTPKNENFRYRIIETEAYSSEDGALCHDYKDGSLRTVGQLVISGGNGLLITCSGEDTPDNVLIRGAITGFFSKPYNLLKSFTLGYNSDENRMDTKVSDLLADGSAVWLEKDEYCAPMEPKTTKRILRTKADEADEDLRFLLNDPDLESPLFRNLMQSDA